MLTGIRSITYMGARRGLVKSLQQFDFKEVNGTLNGLRSGELHGAAVLTMTGTEI